MPSLRRTGEHGALSLFTLRLDGRSKHKLMRTLIVALFNQTACIAACDARGGQTGFCETCEETLHFARFQLTERVLTSALLLPLACEPHFCFELPCTLWLWLWLTALLLVKTRRPEFSPSLIAVILRLLLVKLQRTLGE